MNGEGSFGLHDAEMVAVAVDRLSRIARLDFRKEDGNLYSLEFQGVKAFRTEDLTVQNVVSRILQSSTRQLSGEVLEHWLIWVTSLSDATSWLSAESMNEWHSACEAGILELVVIQPSAGAEIAAVCDRVVLNSTGAKSHVD